MHQYDVLINLPLFIHCALGWRPYSCHRRCQCRWMSPLRSCQNSQTNRERTQYTSKSLRAHKIRIWWVNFILSLHAWLHFAQWSRIRGKNNWKNYQTNRERTQYTSKSLRAHKIRIWWVNFILSLHAWLHFCTLIENQGKNNWKKNLKHIEKGCNIRLCLFEPIKLGFGESILYWVCTLDCILHNDRESGKK